MVIGISSLLASIAFAVVGSLYIWKMPEWYHLYIPILLFLGAYLVCILLWWIFIDIYGRIACLRKAPKKINRFTRFLLSGGMRYIDNHALVRVKMHGKELLPNDQRFLFVQNHASNFDPMIVNAYLGKNDIAFITKPGNFKIPLGGRLMKRLFYQGIERDNPIQSLGVVKNSIDLIEHGVTSIGVYPEGTRHMDGKLGDFHEGVFNICLKAKCPLVVSTITNTPFIHKDFPFKFTHVDFRIVKVYSFDELEGKTALAVANEVKELMRQDLAK